MNQSELKLRGPLVSVVLCSYNGIKYLDEQIRSILDQTHHHIELIIVDDASTDGTIDFLFHYTHDARVSLIINEVNLGPRMSFYKGIQQTRGAYIALSDQDDIWKIDKIERMLESAAQNPDHLLYYSNSRLIDEHGQDLGASNSDRMQPLTSADNRVILVDNFVSGHSCLFPEQLKKYIDPWPEHFWHDRWLCFTALTYGSVYYIDEELQYYRIHASNLTVGDNLEVVKCNPKIREGNLEEWINTILAAPFTKNRGFFQSLSRLYARKGVGAYFLRFCFLCCYHNVVLAPRAQPFFKRINHLRKLARKKPSKIESSQPA